MHACSYDVRRACGVRACVRLGVSRRRLVGACVLMRSGGGGGGGDGDGGGGGGDGAPSSLRCRAEMSPEISPPCPLSPLPTPCHTSLPPVTPPYSLSHLPTPCHPSLPPVTPPYPLSPLPTPCHPSLPPVTPPYPLSPLPTPCHPSLPPVTPPYPLSPAIVRCGYVHRPSHLICSPLVGRKSRSDSYFLMADDNGGVFWLWFYPSRV